MVPLLGLLQWGGVWDGAARRRDAAMLAVLERALAFCTTGHTAGEALLLDSLPMLDDEALLDRLPLLRDTLARRAFGIAGHGRAPGVSSATAETMRKSA